MLAQIFLENNSYASAIIYFFFYSFTLLCFFNTIKNLKTNANIAYLAAYANYSPSIKTVLLCVFVSFLGIPPMFLFSSKFNSLSLIWVNNTSFTFVLALLVTFLSFALYVQVLDLLFKKLKTQENLIEHSLNWKELTKNHDTAKPFTKKIKYNQWNQKLVFILFMLLGAVVFKDLFLVFNIWSV